MHDGLAAKLKGKLAISSGNIFGRVTTLVDESVSNGIGLKIDVETVVATAKSVYDQYIAKIDIPFIPNIIEPTFDALVWRVAEQLIRAAFKKVG